MKPKSHIYDPNCSKQYVVSNSIAVLTETKQVGRKVSVVNIVYKTILERQTSKSFRRNSVPPFWLP